MAQLPDFQAPLFSSSEIFMIFSRSRGARQVVCKGWAPLYRRALFVAAGCGEARIVRLLWMNILGRMVGGVVADEREDEGEDEEKSDDER